MSISNDFSLNKKYNIDISNKKLLEIFKNLIDDPPHSNK